MQLRDHARTALVLGSFFVTTSALAGTYVWTGGGTLGGSASFGAGTAWDNPANWVDGAGAAVADYPDDLADVAYINRQGVVAWNPAISPVVQTPAGSALTVGQIYAGSWFQTNTSLQLQNNLTAHYITIELFAGAPSPVPTHDVKFNGNTITMTGAGNTFQTYLAGGSNINLGNAKVTVEDSGTFSPGYINNVWGLLTLGDSADDNIVLNSGAGNAAFFNFGVKFGPGTTSMNGEITFRDGPGIDATYGGTVTSGDTINSGIRYDYGGAALGKGVYGGRVNIDHYAGEGYHNLTGNLSVQKIYIRGYNATFAGGVDTTAANYQLDVPGSVTINDGTTAGRGIVYLRSSTANLNDVFISSQTPGTPGTGGQLKADAATINISGDFNSSNAASDALNLGTSAVHFTGTSKSLNTAAGLSFYDVYFDGSTSLLSDLSASHLVKATGTVTGGTGIDINLNGGADMDFGSGLVDIDGTLSAGAGSLIDIAGGQLYVGALNLIGGAYIDFFDSYTALLKLTGDQQAFAYSLIGSNTIRTTGSPPLTGFTVRLDGSGDTLVFLPEPGAALSAVALFGLLAHRRRA